MIRKSINEIAGSAREEEGRQAEIGEKANESEEVFRVQVFSVGRREDAMVGTGAPALAPALAVTRRGWWKSASSLRQLRKRLGFSAFLFAANERAAPYSKAVEDSRSPRRPGGNSLGGKGMADTTFEKQTPWQWKIMSKIRSDSIWNGLAPERPVNDFGVLMELELQGLATKSQGGSQLNACLLYACCRIFFEGSCLCGIGGGI